MDRAASAPRPAAAVAFVLVTIVIDTIGFGMIAPVMPELLRELTGEGLAEAARYGGYLMFLFAGIQFFAAPVLGNLSDRFGRRPVLIASLAALGVDYVVMGLAPTLGWLFVARLVSGVAAATFPTANAYVADLTTREERARYFGWISAAWGLGFILGPAFGGLLGEIGPRVPFFAAAGLAGANVLYGLFVLPESLPPEHRRPFDPLRANPIGALARIRHYPVLFGLLAVLVPYQIAHDANPTVWSYYTMLKFGWTESTVGYSLMVVGIAIMSVNALLVAPAIEKLGEVRAVVVGFLAMAGGFFAFAFATRGWMMFAAIFPFALIGIAQPALRGMLANRVPEDAQGELQGVIGSLMSLTMVGSPLLMTQLFSTFSAADAPVYFPGASFLVAGLLALAALGLFARAVRAERARLAREPGALDVGLR